ncbi:MAG: molybdenum cofactor guanylyltransferase [Wenzhouxiangellaceae bacterium]|nr:molybdenum cofactor guanylyltransferase [Wenzhouxiangellaceae bacterium]MBS3823698.1 molybdenum cofactor guanylyltransferase [Wenzhouxiangellaceae bacterium]
MIDRRRITAVVLAGGRARRMGGVDKGLVEIAGKPMIEWTLEALRPQVDRMIINANRSQQAYERLGLPIIEDRHEGFQGPLAGLHAAFAAAASDYLLCVPCDAPRLPPDLAARLGEVLQAHQAEIAVAEAGGRLHSLHALFDCRLASDLATRLDTGERKPDRWYASRRFVRVGFDDVPDRFVNVNTPDQRDALAAMLSGGA